MTRWAIALLGPLAWSCAGEEFRTASNSPDAGAAAAGGHGATAGEAGAAGRTGAAGSGGAGGGAGTAGSAGNAGSSGADPCGGACTGDTPVCNTSTGECVQCTDADHCSGATPACDPSTSRCVACTDNDHCSGDTGFCDTTAHTCVQCLMNDACTDATAARCEAGQCTPCTTNDDCAHLPGNGVCDAGKCVECTGTDYAACGTDPVSETPRVCDSLSRTCSNRAERSSGLCGACVSDAECPLGQLCVLQTFGDPAQDVGYFCFWKRGDTEHGTPATCLPDGRPYARTLAETTSIDGAVGDVCGLAVSTCVARNEFRAKDCSSDTGANDALCGFDGPNDAKCDEVEPQVFRCTMRCGSSDDCPPSFACNTLVAEPYCEL